MLKIIGKEIDLDRSSLLYAEPVSAEMLARDWKTYSGEWWVEEDWICGRNPYNRTFPVAMSSVRCLRASCPAMSGSCS